MVVAHRHILLLALLLASPAVARAAQTSEGTATVPRFEPAPCPKLPGAEELAKASCGYLVVPENRNRPNKEVEIPARYGEAGRSREARLAATRPATANSPPPAPTSAPTIRPRAPPISPTSARRSAMKRGMSTGRPTAPILRRRSCATTRRASAASSSIRSCPRPTTSPQTG